MAENDNVDYDDNVQCGQPQPQHDDEPQTQNVEPQPQAQAQDVEPQPQAQPQHVEPQPQPQHVEHIEIDTASFFVSDNKTWSEREDMLKWFREQARKAGFSVVIGKSNNKGTPVVHVNCQRGGTYDKRSQLKRTKSGKLAREGTGSRKIGCPFHLKGYYNPSSAKWWFVPINGLHNHKMEPKLEGHINAGRLTGKTKELVKELTKCLVQPKSILLNLKKNDENNATTLKQVYNVRHRIRKAERGNDSEVQHLIQKLEEHHYVHFIRTKTDSSTLQDIFWAHPKSIQLLKSFSSVLIMDSTYKTNMYRMPLFEIVGVTSTAMTYSVGFAFLANEKEDNFRWVLEMLRGVLHSKENMPKAIVTDRDNALMKAVEAIFPDTYALLCQFHIRQNVRQHCVKDCKVKPIEGREVKQCDVVDNIMQAWDNVAESPTVESYGDNVIQFREVCKSFPKFLTYVEKTILDVVKKKFVRAWTNKVLHLGNNTTNRVEGAHGVLKQYLMHSGGDLASCWHKVNDMLHVQHTEIQGSFGKSVTVLEHRYKGNFLYSGLEAKVSRVALNFIYEEEARVATLTSAEDCRCVIRTTYGLPCACMLAMKKFHHKSIELDDIHIHWRRLSFESHEEGDHGFSVMEEWNGIQERLRKVPMSMKLHIKEQMRLLAFPEETIVTPPQMNVPPKGVQKRMRSNAASTSRIPSMWERVDAQNPDSQSSKPKGSFPKSKSARIGRPSPSQPKASQVPVPSQLSSQVSPSPVYMPSPLPWNYSHVLEESNPLDYMPLFMQEYIEKYKDVKGDGNCGFRVIAEHMGMHQDNHVLVRNKLIIELKAHKDAYLRVFGGETRYEYLLRGLHPMKNVNAFATEDKWLTFPDMGHIVATSYNKVVILLTRHVDGGKAETFFPIRGGPTRNPEKNIMCLGLIPNHFIHIFLKDGCPIPPTSSEWKLFERSEECQRWEDPFLDRQDLFNGLLEKEIAMQPKKKRQKIQHEILICDTPPHPNPTPPPSKAKNPPSPPSPKTLTPHLDAFELLEEDDDTFLKNLLDYP